MARFMYFHTNSTYRLNPYFTKNFFATFSSLETRRGLVLEKPRGFLQRIEPDHYFKKYGARRFCDRQHSHSCIPNKNPARSRPYFTPASPMIAHVRPAATQDGLLLRRENHCRITLPDRCPGGGGAAAAHPACTPAPCSETPPSSAGRQPRQLSLELMDDILGAFEVPSPAPKEMHQLKKKRKR